jgi:hypothetical protein
MRGTIRRFKSGKMERQIWRVQLIEIHRSKDRLEMIRHLRLNMAQPREERGGFRDCGS